MTYLSSRLAAALAVRATTAAEVDALLPHCHIDRDGLRLATFPSPTVAARMLGGSVGEALTIARHHDLPESLAVKVAADPRKTVRRALAGNSSAPPQQLAQLLAWARRTDDRETLEALVGHAGVDLALEAAVDVTWPNMEGPDGAALGLAAVEAFQPALALARNLARRGPLRPWPALPPAVLFHLGAELAGDPPTIGSLMEALDGQPTRQLAVAAGAWRAKTEDVVAPSVVDVVSAALVKLHSPGGEAPVWFTQALVMGQPPVSGPSLTMLAPVAFPAFLLSLARALTDPSVASPEDPTRARQVDEKVACLADVATPAVAACLLGAGALRTRMSERVRLHLCRTLPTDTAQVAAEVLADPAPLPPAELAHVLRCGSPDLTAAWLNGTLPHRPDLEVFRQLLREPGDSLGAYFRSGALVEAIAVLGRTRTGLTEPLPEVLAPVSGALVDYTASHGEFDRRAAAVADDLAARLAGRVDAQLLALALVGGDFAGSLDDFCQTVLSATS